MDSYENTEKAVYLHQQINKLSSEVGFHVRKWISNCPEILADVPQCDRAAEIDLEKCIMPLIKTLGVLWQTDNDVFTFKYTQPPDDFELTIRNVLKKTATIYDPLGILAPYIIHAKVIVQKAWLCGLDWDYQLPPNLCTEWQVWFSEFPTLQQLRVKSCLSDGQKTVSSLSLQACTDASEIAMGAVFYARHEYNNGTVA